MKEDPFSVLGVKRNASRDEIKAAYHRLCLQFHPDKRPLHEKQNAKHVFSQITEAYNFLTSRNGLHYNNANTAAFRRIRKPKISNVAIASILGIPVVLSAVFIGMRYEQIKKETGRHGGLLNPPMNPFLRPRRAHGLPGQTFGSPAQQHD